MINTYSSHCISPLFLLFIQQLSLLTMQTETTTGRHTKYLLAFYFLFSSFSSSSSSSSPSFIFYFSFSYIPYFLSFSPFFSSSSSTSCSLFLLYFFSLSFFFPSCFSSSVLPFHNFTFCYASATEGGAGGIMFSGCTSVRPYVRPSVRPSRLTVITISQEPFKI